jgi:hypothetical protein
MDNELNIEQQKIDIERERLRIEAERLKLEESKDKNSFLLGVLPTIVSIIAVSLTAFITYQNTQLNLKQESYKQELEKEKMDRSIKDKAWEQDYARRVELFKKLSEKANNDDDIMKAYLKVFPNDDIK